MVIGDFNDMKESTLPFFSRFSAIGNCEKNISSALRILACAIELVEVWDIVHTTRHNSKRA